MKSDKITDRAKYTKAEGRLFIFIWTVSLYMILFPFLSNAATPAKISVKPTSINLGSVKVDGVSTPLMLTTKNTGESDLMINSMTISGTNASEFGYSPTNGCPDPIPTDDSCIVTVTFTPSSPFGKKSATISISSNDPKKPIVNVKLLGKAPPPKISDSPMSVNLGSIPVGGTSSPMMITVKNTGISDLVINSVIITGTNTSEFSQTNDCSTVSAKNSCAVEVIFNPNIPFGKKNAVMSIDSNDPKKPTINIKLSGQAPPPKISAAPMAVNFATVKIRNTSAPETVTIKNTGVSDLVISGISITGTNAQDFNQTNNCSVIAKGSPCTINITFTPSLTASKESASLSISSDDPKKSVLSVNLTGRGDSGTSPNASDSNVMAITVNGVLCSNNSYANKPCVSVTICTPGTSTCQTIDDILLDTGSSGLRIFRQALTVPLATENSGSTGSFAECIQYADGSSNWGPIQIASVILGNEPEVQVPIQVIDSTFGSLPVACENADQSPADAGSNGILGVGFFAQDCGQDCSNMNDNGMYYVCNSSGCQGTAVPLSSQVQNPVALLPQDNNGVIVKLPAVPLGGVPSVDGYLVLGIGTRANNSPSTVKTYTTDQKGEFTTTFNGISYNSFLDTGTNGLFFSSHYSNLFPNCPFPNSDWFCPSSTTSFSATNTGASSSPSGVVPFHIGNFDSLITLSNNVFAEIGGDGAGEFDWGLPFYFGRNVYMGLEGRESSLGSDTYWAY